MRLSIITIITILTLTACVNEPIINPKPLNGIWQSVKLDETSPYILVKMQMLELLQTDNGIVYGGIVAGSGGFNYAHWWVEFEITSGVTDRINNTIRITILTETVIINGIVSRASGRFEGKIFEDKLTGTFQLNELGIAFPLLFCKVSKDII